MRYLSIFSGVEAASVAWQPLGWEPVAFCEIDKYASEVLAKRFPDTPNLGDITKVDWRKFNERYGAIDVVCGGSPCQSFSIAGNREGLDGESRLMFEYIRCIQEVMPRYLIWENVPGCLSSNKGGDFGCLLDELEECGYGLAWRTLDAQFARVPGGSRLGFFGPVPQRRRRVFLVGSLGNQGAAEILFERSCLRGNFETGAKARQAFARDARESIAKNYCNEQEIIDAMCLQGSMIGRNDDNGPNGDGVNDDIAFTLNTVDRHAVAITQYGDEIAGTLTQRGDSSPCADRGQNIVCMADDTAKAAIDCDMSGSLKVCGGTPWIVMEKKS